MMPHLSILLRARVGPRVHGSDPPERPPSSAAGREPVPSELNIRILNEDRGYESSLMLSIIRTLSPVPVVCDWTSRPHLEIRGANRPWRPLRSRIPDKLKRMARGPAKVVLFHTTENMRYEPADFTIGYDLGVT